MMRFGCCGNLIATGADKTGMEFIGEIASLGFDYVELPLAEMTALSEDDFHRLEDIVKESGIVCEACNNFFPASVRLTGPKVDAGKIESYLESALTRAQVLGVSVIVFGSGGAKRVPQGFPYEKAYDQLLDVTQRISALTLPLGITIALEPMRRPDCNILNTFAVSVDFARQLNCSNVKVLIDYYHMKCEKESPDVLLQYGREYLAHVHFSNPSIPCLNGKKDPEAISQIFEDELSRRGWWRTFPAENDGEDYSRFIANLKTIGYTGRVSLEAPVKQFAEEAKAALQLLRDRF